MQVTVGNPLSCFSSVPGSLATATSVSVSDISGQVSSLLPVYGRMISSNCEPNLSNESSSPTFSDSGISVDAASNSSGVRGTASSSADIAALNQRALTNVMSLSSAAPGTHSL